MFWSAEPRRSGFVLLEAVVALAILGAFVAGIFAATGAQVRTAGQASELLTAASLAEDRLSAIRILDYDELNAPPDSLLSGTFPAPLDAFSWSAEIEEMEDEYDLFGVEVVVSGPQEVFPLRSLIHRGRPVFGGTATGGR